MLFLHRSDDMLHDLLNTLYRIHEFREQTRMKAVVAALPIMVKGCGMKLPRVITTLSL